MPVTRMRPIEELDQLLHKKLPRARSRITAPIKSNGSWWLDVQYERHLVTVEWRPGKGFGVSAGDAGFGEGPDEVYADVPRTLKRVLELLKTKQFTRPPDEVDLSKLRSLKNVTQVQLAEQLGINQASLSKMERQSDMHISTLRMLVHALGGELELNAVFPEGRVKLQFKDMDGLQDKVRASRKSAPTRRLKPSTGSQS